MSDLTTAFDIAQREGRESRIKMTNAKLYAGGALGIVDATGYATHLHPATSGMRFIGIALETLDNSGGSAGDKWIRFARKGVFQFNQTGLVQADVGKLAYFSDDNIVTTSPGNVLAGQIVTIDENSGVALVAIDNAVERLEVASVAAGGSTSISTGTGSVKMTTTNAANSSVWIPVKYAGTTYYVPGWTAHNP